MAPLDVTVVSATAEVWSGEAEMVVARTTEGEIGILAGHEPTLGVLAAGEVRITTTSGEKVTATAEDGFLSVDNDQVTIVAGMAEIQ
ncbi:F0F1 H+-transporting ATP synthase subunit epsilon [Pontimonas salivibrio]|uniref:F0F1 H+-transporting ATP synthase subunit epsilon n=1 Tax=Pontimonas salivibrio TaxID=1159327 RepID=A0A2L2BRT1_9MICO|nr:F0F1 ATP synthase subunit epsilon [Pontimonas salivibrio]AVG24369.1 F0F1 H+-transporting ATP synthase subunit epsilon [Pontimonas salivibrio]